MKAQRGSDGTILNAAVLTAVEVARQRVLCPACMLKVFDDWPEGWEVHAAEECEALGEGTPEQRRAEFRHALDRLFDQVEIGTRSRVPVLDLEEFVGFVRTLEGRRLWTSDPRCPFTVTVSEKGLLYLPEGSERARLHRYPRVQIYFTEFAVSGSLDPEAYHGGANQPYILALLRLFAEERADAA